MQKRRHRPHPAQGPGISAGAGSARSQPLRLSFILLPHFSMMAFSAAIEPLRSANLVSGRTLYVWQLVSLEGEPVEASNGIPIAVQSGLASLDKSDMVVVCAGLDPLRYAANRGLTQRLRYLAGHGCRVGAISGGPFVLAEAGLLGARPCTVHWEFRELFAERYPRTSLCDDLFVIDRSVFTCSGGTAALDMMLCFIREQHGDELAVAVAEQFIHQRIRHCSDRQRMEIGARYRVHDPTLVKILRLMEDNLDEPLRMDAIGMRVGISGRQVERLFRRHMGEAPASFYLGLRLLHGRNLLQQTCRSINEIAMACGFQSTSHFSHAYRRRFDRPPSNERPPLFVQYELSHKIKRRSG